MTSQQVDNIPTYAVSSLLDQAIIEKSVERDCRALRPSPFSYFVFRRASHMAGLCEVIDMQYMIRHDIRLMASHLPNTYHHRDWNHPHYSLHYSTRLLASYQERYLPPVRSLPPSLPAPSDHDPS